MHISDPNSLLKFIFIVQCLYLALQTAPVYPAVSEGLSPKGDNSFKTSTEP